MILGGKWKTKYQFAYMEYLDVFGIEEETAR